MTTVFVYGTLTDRSTAQSVLPAVDVRGPATLVGLHRVDGHYPTLAPGGEARGRLLRTDHVETLDAYEGTDRGLYVRVSLPLATAADGDARTVEVYVGDPDRLDVDVSWPDAGSFPAAVWTYVSEHDVQVVPAAGDE